MDLDLFTQPAKEEVSKVVESLAIQVKATTLRAVGEALWTRSETADGGGFKVDITLEDVIDLRNGQMPAGWEGR